MAQDAGMEVEESSNATKYEISSQLTIHQAPVRCLVTIGDDRIISGDRKGNFVNWTKKTKDDISMENDNNNNNNNNDNNTDSKMNDNSNDNDNTNETKTVKKDDTISTNNSMNDFNGRLIFDTGLHDLTFSIMKGNEYTTNDGAKFETYISTGDHMAIQWTLEGAILKQYIGHSNSVISVDMLSNKEQIVTGSFDSTAKIWNLKSKEENDKSNDNSNSNDKNSNNNTGMAEHVSASLTLSGHTHGVEVCALKSGEIVTGTFKNINIWDSKGNKIKTVENAHDHMIRKVRRHPLGFLTCGNDGYVKLWSNSGELLRKILAHPENANTPSFVYGLTCDSDGNIFSSGEDGTAKVFSPEGTLLCVLRHSTVVWDVALMSNSDLVTACGDGCVRIWSKDKSRIADDEAIAEYYNGLTLAVQAQGAPVSDSQLEPMSALKEPGKPGSFKMVNDPNRGPSVYQYDATRGDWVYIGEITGQGGKGGSSGGSGGSGGGNGSGVINGVKYDHVVYIDVNDGDKVPLGFNIDDDPRQISRDFCTINSIDLDLALQIEAHLKPYANAEARAKRLAREAEAAAKVLKHIPNYKVCQSEINGKGNVKGIQKKILEFNNDGKINIKFVVGKNDGSNDSDSKTNDEEIQILTNLFGILSDQSNWHVTEFPDITVKLIANKLIQWPTDKILPVLDVIRMLMLHQSGIVKLLGFNDTSGSIYGKKIRDTILEHINGRDSEFTGNMQLITCRLISNFLAKRSRSEAERKGQCPKDLLEFLQEAISGLAPAAENGKSAIFTAYLMMVHNTMLWFAKFKVEESDLYLLISSALFEMFGSSLKDSKTKKLNEKVLYYGLSVIGTIGWSSEQAKTEILEAFGDELKGVVNEALNQPNNRACQEVGKDVKNVFEL